MKILITGASGFVGGHLCTHLKLAGHQVFGLIRSPRELNYDFHIIKGDLSKKSISSWLAQLPDDLDCVIHTAGIVHSFDKETFDQVNFQGTVDLQQALNHRYAHLQFTFISSLAAVGPSNEDSPHTEEATLSPTSLYGKSKKKAEQYLQANTSKNWKLTIIRPPMVIGPKDLAVLDVFKMVKSHIILSTGIFGMNKRYSFVCVFDLVELIHKTLTPSEQRTRIYFPAYPQTVSFRDIISTIKAQMHVRTVTLPVPMFIIAFVALSMALLRKFIPIDFRLTPDKVHELAPKYWCVSSELSTKELGMNYKWNLEKTIELTYQDYKKRNWL